MTASPLSSGANAKGALVATTEPRSLAVREKQALASQRSLLQQFGGGRGSKKRNRLHRSEAYSF